MVKADGLPAGPAAGVHYFAAMFGKIEARFFPGFSRHMDSEGSSFQSGLTLLPLASVPPRAPAVMPAGAIVAWTPARMVNAMGAWLMEETQLPPLPASVTAPKRHA
jgi:hypothetical protein